MRGMHLQWILKPLKWEGFEFFKILRKAGSLFFWEIVFPLIDVQCHTEITMPKKPGLPGLLWSGQK